MELLISALFIDEPGPKQSIERSRNFDTNNTNETDTVVVSATLSTVTKSQKPSSTKDAPFNDWR